MKFKQTTDSIHRMTPTSVINGILLQAGLYKTKVDTDGRIIYYTKTRPRDFRPAFIEFEELIS